MNDIQIGDYVALVYDDGSQSTVVGRVDLITETETAVLDCGTEVKLSRLITVGRA